MKSLDRNHSRAIKAKVKEVWQTQGWIFFPKDKY